jgi:protein-S-isoprenylcysteine O-methyltransferase Ste14
MNTVTTIANLTPATGFLLLVLLISFNSYVLKKKGVRVSAAGTGKPGNIQWFYPVFAVFFLLFLGEIFNPLYGFSVLPKVLQSFLFNSVLISLTGVMAVLLSVCLMKTTLKDFGNSLRFGMNKNNTGKLVKTGVFIRSRNPFFLSLLLFFTGTALIFPNLFFLIFAVSAFTGIHFSILKEEKFLKQVYGDDYLTYQQKVRRYF